MIATRLVLTTMEIARQAPVWISPAMIGVTPRKGFAPLEDATAAIYWYIGPMVFEWLHKYDNVCVAGGIVEKALTAQYSPFEVLSDIDIFITGPEEEQLRTLHDIIRGLPKAYFSFRAGAIDVYIPEHRVIQLVILRDTASTLDVLYDFDMSYIQTAYTRDGFLITPEASVAISTGITASIQGIPKRYLKAIMQGYSVLDTASINPKTRKLVEETIADMAANPECVWKNISNHIITHISNLPPGIEQVYYLGQIRKQCPAHALVTADPEEVIARFERGNVYLNRKGLWSNFDSCTFDNRATPKGFDTSTVATPTTSLSTTALETVAGSTDSLPTADVIASLEGPTARSAAESSSSSSSESTCKPETASASEQELEQEPEQKPEQVKEQSSLLSFFNRTSTVQLNSAGRIRPLTCGCPDYEGCTHRKKREPKKIVLPSVFTDTTVNTRVDDFRRHICPVCTAYISTIGDPCHMCAAKARLRERARK